MPQLAVAAIAAAGSYATWGTAFGTALANLSASLLLSTASQALLGKSPRSADIQRELARPTTTPQYRAVYGTYRVPGTPAPWMVKGNMLYGCLILNSRPSTGPFKVFVDKREQTLTGNIYNFGTGGGARPTTAPLYDTEEGSHGPVEFVRFWIGRGDQTQPPQQILDEVPELFQATDAWRGMTVIWIRANAGRNRGLTTRWPASPPNIEVEGNWTPVWDPRTNTTGWSDNHALCILDALMNNPVRKFHQRDLIMDHFIAAANIADEDVPLSGGGYEARYSVGGILVWTDAEIEDQLAPMAAAGAARFIRAGGKLGIAPGAWVDPLPEVADILAEDGLDFQRWAAGNDLPTSISASYTSAQRGYEDADLGQWPIPGALEADGGVDKPVSLDLTWITSPTQAMRVQRIEGLRARMQRQIRCTLPPSAIRAIAGSVLPLTAPAPYAAMSGTYEVQSINLALDPMGDDGVAMRCPVVLKETAASVYYWEPGFEYEIGTGSGYNPQPPDVSAPTALSATSMTINGAPVIRFSFDPVESALAARYEWEWTSTEQAAWRSGGSIAFDLEDIFDRAYGILTEPDLGAAHSIRVRTVNLVGQVSAWATITGIVASPPATDVPPPTPVSATGGAGQIAVEFTAPNHPDFRAIEVYGSAINDPGTSSLVDGPRYVSPNAVVETIVSGLGSGETLYFWSRSIDQYAAASGLSSPSISATTS
ncbi:MULTISPECIES: hypothetical protein [unclassified Haematobacter]|uniref:hypothetical protein n=1 Tax=unclassified Haematobacter TaxID=2640585 RepID=UPI0025C2ABE5|nr:MULTISPECIES: hypothetical protein [unclassified Haematobacter]